MSDTTALPFSLSGKVTRSNEVYKDFYAHIEPKALLHKPVLYSLTFSAPCVKNDTKFHFGFQVMITLLKPTGHVMQQQD